MTRRENKIEQIVSDIIWRKDDDYVYKGGRKRAIESLKQNDSPFARFFVALMNDDMEHAISLAKQHRVLALTAKQWGEKLKLLDSYEDPKLYLDVVRHAYTVWTLCKQIGGEVESLIEELKDGNPDIREAAAYALGETRDHRAVGHLIPLLKDGGDFVRISAAEALGSINDPGATEHLIMSLADPNPDMRRAAVIALGRIRDIRAIEPLFRSFVDSNPGVRSATATALQQFRDPRLPEFYRTKLNHFDPEVRRKAAENLGDLKDAGAVECLVLSLEDEEYHVRVAAAKALESIKDLRSVDALIQSLWDKEQEVRDSAASALAEINDQKAIEPLISTGYIHKLQTFGESAVPRLLMLLEDRDHDCLVRRAAIRCLSKIKKFKSPEPLVEALSDNDFSIRDVAFSRLKEITCWWGDDPNQWKQWWAQNWDLFTPEAAAIWEVRLKEFAECVSNEKTLSRALALVETFTETQLKLSQPVIAEIVGKNPEYLVFLVGEHSSDRIQKCIFAIPEIGQTVSSSPVALRTLLGEQSTERTRRFAYRVVAQNPSEETLKAVLQSGDSLARACAAELLSEIGTTFSLDMLKLASQTDEDEYVRDMAGRAAHMIQSRSAGPTS